MSTRNIFDNVCSVIESSVGIPKDSIKPDQTLFDELEIDSIDLVDILFELETMYDVELKVSDIEKKAKDELGDQPYEVDGVITEAGLKVLKGYMTEVDQSKLVEGLTVHELVQLFTVQSLCNIVSYKLEEKESA